MEELLPPPSVPPSLDSSGEVIVQADDATSKSAARPSFGMRQTMAEPGELGQCAGPIRLGYQPRSAFCSFHARRKSHWSAVVGLWLLAEPTIMIEPPVGLDPVQS